MPYRYNATGRLEQYTPNVNTNPLDQLLDAPTVTPTVVVDPTLTAAQFYRGTLQDIVYAIKRGEEVIDPYTEMKAKATKVKKPANLCAACNRRPFTKIIGRYKWCDDCATLYSKMCGCGCGTLLIHNNINDDTHYLLVRNACPEIDTLEPDEYKETWWCDPCTRREENIKTLWSCIGCMRYFSDKVTPAIKTERTTKCARCKYTMHKQLLKVQKHTANVLDYLHPYKPPVGGLQFGVELEVQFNARIEQTTKTAMVRELLPDFVICKHDGSLLKRPDEYTGFEIVSVPATIAEHKTEWSKLLNIKHGLYSWKTGDCGMHIHITRSALTMLQIGRMLKFVNSTDNAKLIQIVAGRHSTKYSTIYDKNITDVRTPMTGDYDFDRRQAVNLSNAKTVEIRIFRGNLKPESFFKNLEFVAALVSFCRDTGNNNLTTPVFVEYINKNRAEYPYLVRFFNKVNMLQRNMRPSQLDITTIAGLKELEKDKIFTYDNV